MSQAIGIIIDGINYKVGVVFPEIGRSFELKEGSNTGTSITGRNIRDVLGTNYTYSMKITALPGFHDDYDRLYEVISEPVDSHMVTLPYNQTTITFEAEIKSGSDKYYGVENGTRIWSDLDIEFAPIAPQRR